MAKYTILYIEDSIGVGGSLVSLCNFLVHLDRTKFDPLVVVYHDNQKAYLESRKVAVRRIIVAAPRPSVRSTLVGRTVMACLGRGEWGEQLSIRCLSILDLAWSVFPYAFGMWRRLRRESIAFIHLNTGVCLPGIALSWLLGVPCMATQRGPEYPSRMISWFAMSVKQFIAISKTTKADLLRLGVSENKIVVEYPPVDCNRFDPALKSAGYRAQFLIEETAPIFGIFGVLEEWKGHHVFLEATKMVLDAIPNSVAFIVGDTPTQNREYKERLVAHCRRLGIEKHVVFTGFREDVPELMGMLDVIVHASIIPEPFGKVVIEGMAMGKPVVATEAGGPAEVIESGYDGFLVPPKEARPMADCIIRLLQDRELARKMGEAACEKVRKRFGVLEYVAAVERLYGKMVTLSDDSAKPVRSC
jgi:glycosyltransferase involved in cell wall biosynthesis